MGVVVRNYVAVADGGQGDKVHVNWVQDTEVLIEDKENDQYGQREEKENKEEYFDRIGRKCRIFHIVSSSLDSLVDVTEKGRGHSL